MSLRDEILHTIHEHASHMPGCGILADKIVDIFLTYPAIKEMQEKAEKWDGLCHKDMSAVTEVIDKRSASIVPFVRARINLDLLMSGLVVEEKCPNAHQHPPFNGQCLQKICDCHGTGTITRPPTVGEVRELINALLSNEDLDIYRLTATMTYQLASGAILRMEDKK